MRRSVVVLALAACTAEPCPPGALITGARAADPTHVEVTLACPAAMDDIRIEALVEGTTLPVHGVERSGTTLSVTTDPMTALRTYTLRAQARDGEASANFVGVGDTETAPVTITVDDRYHQSLAEVYALVSVDPATGVFTHYSTRVPLADPDGDHVFTTQLAVAVDPLRSLSELDDRLGPERQAYAARAVAADGTPLSPLIAFEVRSPAASEVILPLLSVPDPPGPEGLVTVHVRVDDTPAQALSAPTLRASVAADGSFDPTFPTTLPLTDPDGDRVFTAALRVRIDPRRVIGGTTSTTFPYVLFVADENVDYPGVGVEVEALTESDVDAAIRVGDPALVPVTFRVDVSAAYLNSSGALRGLYPGEAVVLTGGFPTAEDAFGQNASDSFTGGENVVLEMHERADHPGVWERTLFLPPSRPYSWKVVRCPIGKGCADLNRHVTSSGRAFATVMKNLATENRDAGAVAEVRIVDPRDPRVTLVGGGTLDYTGADVYQGSGVGLEPDPAGTPDGVRLFKQELPDLVVDVGALGAGPVVTPVIVVGTWRDVNLPWTLAEILAGAGTFDLNPWDYDSGFVGAAAPSYVLAPPPPPPPFVVGDGLLDASAVPIAGGGPGTMSLFAALSGTTLYVATQDAGEGSDHFLFVSASAPTGALAAPWGKAGTVALPAAALFLADENDSVFAGWFALGPGTLLEAAGADARADLACGASGGYLEGTVDLASLFGAVPTTIYLAAAPYGSADGSAMYSSAQMPATIDGNGNLDPGEVAAVPTASITVAP